MSLDYRTAAARPSTTAPAALLGLILLGGVGAGYWIGSRNDPPRPARPEPVAVAAVTPAPEPPPAPAIEEPPPKPAPKLPPVKPKKLPLAVKLPKKPDPAAEMPATEMPAAEMTPPATVTPPTKPAPPATKPAPPPTKPAPAKPPAATLVTFEKILPVFQAKCLGCHGAGATRGGLDLRTVAAIMKGGNGGKEITPGDPDKSFLWDSVMNDSMPPDGKEKLTEAEKKLIRDWILAGAK